MTTPTRNRQYRWTPGEIRLREPQLEGSLGVLYGKAIAKGVWSSDRTNEGWKEMIAMDCEIEYQNGDIKMDMYHERNRMLGRLKSRTLRLDNRKDGLYFELDVPDTTNGRDLVELVKRGDVQGMSFEYYSMAEDYSYDNDGIMQVVVNKMVMRSITAAIDPTWAETSIAERSREIQAMRSEEDANQSDLQDYYTRKRYQLAAAMYEPN